MNWQNDPLVLALFTYFLGAIPFSAWVAQVKGIDLRNVGSGNYGATNVFRALGFKYALLVFILDMTKGYIPTLLALQSDSTWFHIGIGALAIIGHSFSPFVKFRGGKGAATGLGVLLGLSPAVFGSIFAVAIIGIFITRYVAPVTILCSLLAPLLFYLLDYPESYIIFTSCIAVFIIWRHKANIQRLIQGKENRI
jgi:glycerol-3-phosphate acyltransferase PlsY